MKKVLLILFGWVMLAGCQSVDYLSIDYLLPAEMSFPKELRKVAVVNNVVGGTPTKLASQFTDVPDVNARMQYHKTQYFSGDSKTATEALAQTLADGDYFDTVIICDSALRAGDREERRQTLTREEVDDLTQQLGVDFLIALENLELRAVSKAQPDYYTGIFVANTDVKVAPTVRIYMPRQNPRTPIYKVDSIFWQGFGDDINESVHELPNQQTVVKEASHYAGEFIAKTFVPYWETSTRYYFTNGSVSMRDAAVFVKEDRWDEALTLWQKAYDESKNAKKKMYASYNLALGHEMLDNIDQAIEWATKAQQYAQQAGQVEVAQLAGIYLQQLNTRKQSYASIKMQMQRFDEDF
jgi:tetratricopeptide (TPR) repeat protein